MRQALITASALGALCLCGLPARSRAMDIPSDLKMRFMGNDADARGKSMSAGPSDAPDNSIDSLRYMVGAGDGFRISIVGMPSQEYTPVIDLKGNLYEGDIGLIPLGKVNLAAAQSIIAEKVVKALHNKYQVYVTLRHVKSAGITVSGMVSNSGTYVMAGNLHLLDAIKLANGGNVPPLSKVDFRSVEIRNGDSVKVFDLLRFLSKQDISQNPYVYPGDNIHLGAQDARVFVAGEIQDPIKGAIPLKPGETLGDILSLLRLKHSADSGSILIHSAGGGSSGPVNAGDFKSKLLGNNDVITIGSRMQMRRPDTVALSGEVNRPGTYALTGGDATIASILAAAGGATAQGDTERVFILRHRKMEQVMEGFTTPEYAGPPSALPANAILGSMETVRPEVFYSMNDLRQSGDFSVIEGAMAREKGVLEDGDEINIPRRERFVYVSGCVRSPGAYPFVAGAGPEHYVDQAQGYSDKADKKNIYVLATYKSVMQLKPAGNPRAGDIIVVPTAVEYKRFTNIYLPLLQIIPAIISVVLTIVIVAKQKGG